LKEVVGALLVGLVLPTLAVENPDRLSDAADGATCEYFNRAAGGAWLRRRGDWRDASGVLFGERPYSDGVALADQRQRIVQMDVTPIVADWSAGRVDPAHGMLLRSTGTHHGIGIFASREASDLLSRPTLLLQLADDSRRLIEAAADTFLDCTTEKSMGSLQIFKAGGEFNALLRFPFDAGTLSAKVVKATLSLALLQQYGQVSLGVFATTPPSSPDAVPRLGIAANFPGDIGIENHPDVWFATGFESLVWPLAWNRFDPRSNASAVVTDDDRLFVPLNGRALRVGLAKGANRGLDMRFTFAGQPGGEPEEAYFRYYLRFSDDWNPDVDGGKMPGFAGTYGRAGWGMRKSSGADGWSMRGQFYAIAGRGNPRVGSTALGTYAYHADISEASGEAWVWPLGRLAALERNRWYSVEQYVRLNTPGRKDGVLRAWIDGRLAFEKVDIRMRTVPELKIENVWFNVYHGGTLPAPRDMHLYIDNVVIARKYIGPMPTKTERSR
jgi:hypothetical protein